VILSANVLIGIQAIAQNVGVGTTTPQAKLDIVNSFRAGGLNNYFSYDSSGRINWTNSFIYAPSAQAIIRSSQTSLHYINNQLEYRDGSNNPVFYTNWNTGNAFFAGKLGIGVSSPEARLHLPPLIQEKIIMYGNSLQNNYGIGVESYQLRLHGDGAGNMAFGYGRANDFHEGMRIEPSGMVGISAENQALEASIDVRKNITSSIAAFQGSLYFSYFGIGSENGTYLRGGADNAKLILNDIPGGTVGIGVEPAITDGILDINGTMRIRRGASSAGIWLNKVNNSGVAGFIGMEDDTHLGFYGNVSGWKFGLNTATGAIRVNGSEGDSAKVLQSNGSGSPPSWVLPSNTIANNVFTLNLSGPITVSNGNGSLDLPGSTQSISVPASSAKVIISFDIYAFNNSCFACANSGAYIYIVVDNNLVSQNAYYLKNGTERQLSGTYMTQLITGNHTIKLMCSCAGASITFGCSGCSNARRMVVEVINN
jgi:hypothetical protein